MKVSKKVTKLPCIIVIVSDFYIKFWNKLINDYFFNLLTYSIVIIMGTNVLYSIEIDKLVYELYSFVYSVINNKEWSIFRYLISGWFVNYSSAGARSNF